MGATLRAGLSLGVCGFSFWSHDIGGFMAKPSVDVYRRWMAFGMLTSHSRSHGMPPREPWEFGEAFMKDFRAADEMKYRLMPYIYAQSKDCTRRGLPMLRALFVEFPDDPGSWLVDDAYLLGSSMLVAPLIDGGTNARDVYLPPGNWIDYQTKKVYAGGWHRIEAGSIPAVILVRDGTIIPRIALAQSTADMNWSKLELAVFSTDGRDAKGLVCLPADQKLREVSAIIGDGGYSVIGNPFEGKAEAQTSTQVQD
jgi:alpha-D-xyloside xylohydrolase